MPECPGKEAQFTAATIAATIDRRIQHPEFGHFVRPWLERATDPEPFAALIDLWVAFNSWLCEIVTDPNFIDSDAALVSAAAKDRTLCIRVNALLVQDAPFRDCAEEFRSLLPIFNVRMLDRKNIGSWYAGNTTRPEYRVQCFSSGADPREYRPKCWWNHQLQVRRGKRRAVNRRIIASRAVGDPSPRLSGRGE